MLEIPSTSSGPSMCMRCMTRHMLKLPCIMVDQKGCAWSTRPMAPNMASGALAKDHGN